MTRSELSLGSLCTGYGGLDLAVQRVFGGELSWVADSDPACARLLAERFPVPNLGDITTVDWNTVPRVTVLSVSPPCQPFSLAGKRRGADDPRHLWPHIEQALTVLRPQVLVLEQVPGIISLGLREYLHSLDQLGYVGRWGVVAAAHAGAPHLRRRLFLIGELAAAHPARLAGRAAADPPLAVPDLPATRALARRRDRRTRRPEQKAPADTHSLRGNEGLTAAPLLQRPDAVFPGRPDRRADRRAAEATARPQCLGHRNPRPQGWTGLRTAAVPGRPADDDPAAESSGVDWGEYTAAIRRWEHILRRPAPHPADQHRRLRGQFTEWLQGLDEGWICDVAGLTRADQLRLSGGGVNVLQGELALRLLLDLPTAPHH